MNNSFSFIKTKISLLLFLLIPCSIYTQSEISLMEKYHLYRDRLLTEFILVSPEVEQFGTNIPAIDRRLDSEGNPVWVSWSDGNSNFNQWLGILATEYRLLKNNGQDYQETLSMLLYSMLAIERLDLYSEYLLRQHHKKYIIYNGDTIYNYILLPDDINGFLIRDDVSLGFWKQYHNHFKAPFGEYNKIKDATNTYNSVFRRGLIPKQGMSQDNIFYLMQTLAVVKAMTEPESIKNIELKFINNIIPEYLSEKNIISNDSVYFDRWVIDITDRLVRHIRQEYPKPEISLKPFRNNWRAKPSKHILFAIMSTRWYIMNPVSDSIVREGSGEDMGVWMNSYGAAKAANTITGTDKYHYDNSDRGLSKYLFKSLVFKNMRFLKIGGIPLPEEIDDYMFRSLATIADINPSKNSYKLLHTLRDKRDNKTYEHNPLILYLLHKDKYKNVYKPGVSYYEEDKQYYEYMLNLAPKSGPTTDQTVEDYHPFWTSSSRLTWPRNEGWVTSKPMDFAGMDYMYLHNLYRLVFDSSDYYLPDNRINAIESKFYKNYPKPDFTKDAEYNYMPPEIVDILP